MNLCCHLSEAEVINNILYNPAQRHAVFENCDKHDFSNPSYQQKFIRAKKIWTDGDIFDTKPVHLELAIPDTEKRLEVSLSEAIRNIKSMRIRREFKKMATEMLRNADDLSRNISSLRSDVETMAEIMDRSGFVTSTKNIKEAIEDLEELYNDEDRPQRVSWGVTTLDKAQLYPKALATVGARPRIGKTALACSCIARQAKAGIKSMLVCFEMDHFQIALRFLSQELEKTFLTIRENFISETSDIAVQQRILKLKNRSSEIFLFCGKVLSTDNLIQLLREARRKHQIEVAYIDYFQLIKHRPKESFRLSVMNTCQSLKSLACDLNIPIVLLSQLNRDADNGLPKLCNLAETSSIEQDSDIVYLLDRKIEGLPWKRDYQRRTPWGTMEDVDMDTKCAAIIAKNRNGVDGVVYLDFDKPTMCFR
jgi:replicative DNA helicase